MPFGPKMLALKTKQHKYLIPVQNLHLLGNDERWGLKLQTETFAIKQKISMFANIQVASTFRQKF